MTGGTSRIPAMDIYLRGGGGGGGGGGGVGGVCVLVPCQKKTFKIKYGFEGSISNAAVGLF